MSYLFALIYPLTRDFNWHFIVFIQIAASKHVVNNKCNRYSNILQCTDKYTDSKCIHKRPAWPTHRLFSYKQLFNLRRILKYRSRLWIHFVTVHLPILSPLNLNLRKDQEINWSFLFSNFLSSIIALQLRLTFLFNAEKYNYRR